jgi:hypothetical protein
MAAENAEDADQDFASPGHPAMVMTAENAENAEPVRRSSTTRTQPNLFNFNFDAIASWCF